MRTNIMIAILFASVAALATTQQSVAANNPFAAGQCTRAAWDYWVREVGQAEPSRRSAMYWLTDAQSRGFRTGSTPAGVSIMVISGGTDGVSNGHVAGVPIVYPQGGDQFLLRVDHANWPIGQARTRDWVAYDRRTRRAWFWNGQSWSSRSYGVLGFIYRK